MSSKRESGIVKSISVAEDICLPGEGVPPRDAAAWDVSEALECLRLWFAIRTDDGRKRALESLSLIVEDEQR